MLKDWLEILMGNLAWKYLKIVNGIDSTKVVLVLTGENELVDWYALKYLDRAIDRKQARKALILAYEENILQLAEGYPSFLHSVRIKRVSKRKIDLIYGWYRMVKFNKNLFFTFTDKTKDNLLGRFIRETEINEKDAVCLAIYNFRIIPEET